MNKKNNDFKMMSWKQGILMIMLMGQVICLNGCGKQEELVFHTDTEQTQSAVDDPVSEDLRQKEEQTGASLEEQNVQTDPDPKVQTAEQMEISQENTLIYVDICGAVAKPGVYQMKSGSRLFEVIELAGGLQEDAAVRYVNQARTVQDGEQILIMTEAEVEEALAAGEMDSQMKMAQMQGNSVSADMNGIQEASGAQASTKININTASAQELMTLTGVGESKANLIIQYREDNGGFSSTEEMMNIEGIGEKTYAKFAENITVQ